MEVICTENNCGNANFTVGQTYLIDGSYITCNYIQLRLPEGFILVNGFEFAHCKFRLVRSE